MEGEFSEIKNDQPGLADHIEDVSLDEWKPIVSWLSLNWTCYYCSQVFHDYESLKSHLECLHSVIHNDINYQCSDCDEVSCNYASFLNHIRFVHYDALKLCCDVCSEILSNFEELSSHRNKHVEAGVVHPVIYHCILCQFAHSTETDLKFHMTASHRSQDFNQTSTVDDGMRLHFKTNAPSDDYEADSTLPPPIKRKKKLSKDPCCTTDNMITYSRMASPGTYAEESTVCVEKFSESILFKKYFKVLKELNETDQVRQNPVALVQCCVCNGTLKGSLRITSNFIRHLRLQHLDQYKEYIRIKSTGKTKKQDHFDKLILRFIISNTLPLSIVESDSFKELIGYANAEPCLVDKNILQKRIDQTFLSMRHNVQTLLQNQKYFCTAANILSTKYKRFFCYTCHWFAENFERQSVALACKRINGPHSSDQMFDIIKTIHSEFGLNSQNVVATFYYNNLDYTKAFKEFGLDEILLSNEEYGIEMKNNHDSDFSTNISQKTFPKPIRCATNTLILVAFQDFMRIIKGKTNYKKHRDVIQKCCSVWKNMNNAKDFEMSTYKIGEQMNCPVVTQWKSLFDSIKDLVSHKKNINKLCQQLELPLFDEEDFKYLEEYIEVMQPLTDAIEFLQQSEHTIFGFLLPTLATIRTKYLKICKNSTEKRLKILATYLLSAVEKRFENFYNLNEEANEAIVSSVLCPSLKLRWVTALNSDFNNEKTNDVVNMVKRIIAKESKTGSDSKNLNVQNKQFKHQFFDFSLTDEPETLTFENSVYDAEFYAYLSNPSCAVDMLDRYPFIKELYTKFNTPLPSSAAVEKLFSLKTLINAPGRGSLSDCNFEKFILLKINDSL